MGRRKGDWVCKECHRVNWAHSEYCDRCGKHRYYSYNKQRDFSKIR